MTFFDDEKWGEKAGLTFSFAFDKPVPLWEKRLFFKIHHQKSSSS